MSKNDEKYILYGGPERDNMEEGAKSLGEFIMKRLELQGDKVALIDGVTSDEITYTQILQQSIEVAKCLRAAGVNKGDVVALTSENRFEFPLVLFGAILVGAKVAPLNVTYTEREFVHAFGLSHPKIVFSSPFAVEKVVAMAKNIPHIEHVILFGDEAPADTTKLTLFGSFLAKYKRSSNEKFQSPPANMDEEIALILCSSGTTGLPKGVQLSQFNLVAAAEMFISGIMKHYGTSEEGVRIMGLIPWFHAFGCLTLIGSTVSGTVLVLLPKFDEGLFLSCIERNYSREPFKALPVDLENDISIIFCSSGTTGLPKGVQLTHSSVLLMIAAYADNKLLNHEMIRVLNILPWFHSFGCCCIMAACVGKFKTVFVPKFEPTLFLSCIENYQINLIFMVPPLMVFLAKHPLVDNYDLTSLRELMCGAAPLSKETEDAVYKRLHKNPSLRIRQGFGMSETTLSVVSQSGDDVCKPGSVGTLLKGVWAKVIDPDTGRALGPNKPGELCFKGSQIMKGYIGDDAATQNTIDKNGFLHTGDIGYYDEDFNFFIIDRLKELIKFKGYQVPPAEIEAVLLTHAKISDAAVIGKPDEASGELPMAFIVKQADVELTEAEVVKYVEDRVSSAKRLRGGVRFIDAIPKNLSGKILRRELRALLAQQKSKL